MWFVFTQEISFIVSSLALSPSSSCCGWFSWFCRNWSLKRNMQVLVK